MALPKMKAHNHVWVYSALPSGKKAPEEYLSGFEQKGISIEPYHKRKSTQIGILFFSTVNEQLFAQVRDLVNQHHQIFAISFSPKPLNDEIVWTLLSLGIHDVLYSSNPKKIVSTIVAKIERLSQVEKIIHSPLIKNNLCGHCELWLSALRQLIEATLFTNSSILLMGESGTGKELMARLVHTLNDNSRNKELITLDCSTIVPELSGSEFFGHKQGSFTGAADSREGAFALADKGTLFLDELGELPLTLQAQLLRIIQEHKYKRVGGNKWQKTDFRLVCATNRDLQTEVAEHRFRGDLFYRIADCVIKLPPLRKRIEDIPDLIKHFVKNNYLDNSCPKIDECVTNYLCKRGYPGNVRELRQIVNRICHQHVGDGPITAGDIPFDERPTPDNIDDDWQGYDFELSIRNAILHGADLKTIGEYAKDTAVRIVVNEEEGNLQSAARRLGVTDRTLQLRRNGRII